MKPTKLSILDTIIKARNGHYCHCVEVSEVYELETLCECIIDEYADAYTEEEIIEFFSNMSVYYLHNEEEIYNFSFSGYIKDTV